MELSEYINRVIKDLIKCNSGLNRYGPISRSIAFDIGVCPGSDDKIHVLDDSTCRIQFAIEIGDLVIDEVNDVY